METSISLHRILTASTTSGTACKWETGLHHLEIPILFLYFPPSPNPDEAIPFPLDQALESCLPIPTLQLKLNCLMN